MNILANNSFYTIWNEYETTFLTISKKKKNIVIGDFYGDPECAIIDKYNKFCVVGGCGIIIYYFKRPFLPYKYNTNCTQWKEYYRDGSIYVINIIQLDRNRIEIIFENGEKEIIQVL